MIGIVLLGQSNSGKSTIGKVVASRLGIEYISSGDIARSINDVQVQEDLNSGELAPEDIIRKKLLHKINSCSSEAYILDGFPRFYEQYEWLHQSTGNDLVYVYVDVPYEDILERAKLRQRDDDKSIEKKMQFFKDKTAPMLREMFDNEDIYIIDNSNERSVQDGIDALIKIVEEYTC